MRITGPKCRLCRRVQKKLFLKGQRCFTAKCPIEKRRQPPGKISLPAGKGGVKRTRLTDYGQHLHAVQSAKRHYWVPLAQFKRYFAIAYKTDNPAEELIRLLERRLDNVVYRLGFALSRAHARQLIRHKHILVNGRRVTIPSYLTRPADRIEPQSKEKSVNQAKMALQVRRSEPDEIPGWLKVTQEDPPIGLVLSLPDVKETQISFEPQAIVEYLTR